MSHNKTSITVRSNEIKWATAPPSGPPSQPAAGLDHTASTSVAPLMHALPRGVAPPPVPPAIALTHSVRQPVPTLQFLVQPSQRPSLRPIVQSAHSQAKQSVQPSWTAVPAPLRSAVTGGVAIPVTKPGSVQIRQSDELRKLAQHHFFGDGTIRKATVLEGPRIAKVPLNAMPAEVIQATAPPAARKLRKRRRRNGDADVTTAITLPDELVFTKKEKIRPQAVLRNYTRVTRSRRSKQEAEDETYRSASPPLTRASRGRNKRGPKRRRGRQPPSLPPLEAIATHAMSDDDFAQAAHRAFCHRVRLSRFVDPEASEGDLEKINKNICDLDGVLPVIQQQRLVWRNRAYVPGSVVQLHHSTGWSRLAMIERVEADTVHFRVFFAKNGDERLSMPLPELRSGRVRLAAEAPDTFAQQLGVVFADAISKHQQKQVPQREPSQQESPVPSNSSAGTSSSNSNSNSSQPSTPLQQRVITRPQPTVALTPVQRQQPAVASAQ
ncbi:MAG: hypothetical protein MHM6MM_003136 [Cercozoa sp. M6MM]